MAAASSEYEVHVAVEVLLRLARDCFLGLPFQYMIFKQVLIEFVTSLQPEVEEVIHELVRLLYGVFALEVEYPYQINCVANYEESFFSLLLTQAASEGAFADYLVHFWLEDSAKLRQICKFIQFRPARE